MIHLPLSLLQNVINWVISRKSIIWIKASLIKMVIELPWSLVDHIDWILNVWLLLLLMIVILIVWVPESKAVLYFIKDRRLLIIILEISILLKRIASLLKLIVLWVWFKKERTECPSEVRRLCILWFSGLSPLYSIEYLNDLHTYDIGNDLSLLLSL